MRNIIKLNEKDLTKLIKKIMNEASGPEEGPDDPVVPNNWVQPEPGKSENPVSTSKTGSTKSDIMDRRYIKRKSFRKF
jgi:hypothetical protein